MSHCQFVATKRRAPKDYINLYLNFTFQHRYS